MKILCSREYKWLHNKTIGKEINYQRLYTGLLRYAKRKLPSQDAEDVTQTAMLRLVYYSSRSTVNNPYAYAMKTLQTCIHKYYHKYNNEPKSLLIDEEAMGEWQFRPEVYVELSDIEREIGSMDEVKQSIIKRRAFGMTLTSVARDIGISRTNLYLNHLPEINELKDKYA